MFHFSLHLGIEPLFLQDNCAICQEPVENKYITLQCDHHLHFECCEKLYDNKKKDQDVLCPLCRHPLK